MQKINRNKYWILLIGILSMTFHAKAQQLVAVDEKAYTDSLQTILQTTKSDSTKARINFLLSDYWRSKDTLKSKQYLSAGKSLAKNNPLLNALYSFYEGQFYYYRDNNRAAEAFLRAVNELSAFTGKDIYRFTAAAWCNYAIMKRVEKGDEFLTGIILNKSIPIVEKAGDAEKTAHYYGQLATIFMYNAQFDKAELYYNKAIDILERNYPNSTMLLWPYLSASSNYIYLKKAKEAKALLDKASRMLKPYPESINYPNYYLTEAQYYLETNEYAKALVSLNSGIPLAKKYNQTLIWQTLVFRKYETLSGLKQYGQAKEILLGLLTDGPLKDDINSRKTMYSELAKTNTNLGMMGEAYKWATSYSKLSDSINESRLKENINAQEIKFRTAENQQKITELNAANQKANLTAKNSRLINWLLGFASLLLLAIMISALFFYRFQKRAAAQKTQIGINQAMIQAQEKERTRVARDLHDGLGGMLTMVKLNLEDFSKTKTNTGEAGLHNIIGQLNGSIKELRRIAHNMMPEMLLNLGLETSLRDLCELLTTQQLHINFQPLGIQDSIPVEEQVSIYRIIQELLTNIVKHAGAQNVLLQCAQQGTAFFITIEDDGKGFGAEQLSQKTGIGLNNIKNRVAVLRGKLDILSDERQGTSINIELNVSK